MDNKQLALAYATAKIMGYKKSVDAFKTEFLEIYNKTIGELNSTPPEIGTAEAMQNPFRRIMR